MRIAACIKRVPVTGGRTLLTGDARASHTQHLGSTMSPHEECGVEEAVRLIEANKGDSLVLTLGPSEAVEQLRDAMALGIDRAIHLQTDGQEWDAEATAGALLDAIRADEPAHGPLDRIFFVNESAAPGGFPAASAAAGAREARGSGGSGPARRVSRQRRRGGAGGRRDAAEGGRFVSVLVLMEDGDPSRQTLTLARKFGEPRSVRIDAILPFAPDALATALAQAADELDASAVFAAGTERGNEVMARLAARMDLPFAANCIAAAPGDPVEVTRLRWGGSLLEEARLHSPRPLITRSEDRRV